MASLTREPINVAELSPAQIARIFQLYEELLGAVLASNNELVKRLFAVEGTTNSHAAVLGDWSQAVMAMNTVATLEVERLTATMN